VNPAAQWDYTLGHQVTDPYDFVRVIRTAAREFGPDLFILTELGPTLGGAVPIPALRALVQNSSL
jgi:[acyl-carrier-protein] S-malonyltransferase